MLLELNNSQFLLQTLQDTDTFCMCTKGTQGIVCAHVLSTVAFSRLHMLWWELRQTSNKDLKVTKIFFISKASWAREGEN